MTPKMLSDWFDLDFNVFKNSEGEAIIFRHIAKVCECEVDENQIQNIDAHDVSSVDWINVSDREFFSQLVIETLKIIKS